MSPAIQDSSLWSAGKHAQGKEQGTLELQSIKFVAGTKAHFSPAQPCLKVETELNQHVERKHSQYNSCD